MQFTGLTDKNGKEIYEGDIIAMDGEPICPITFQDGCFQMIMSENQGMNPVSQFKLKMYEVIGNIYENSDLLEVKK